MILILINLAILAAFIAFGLRDGAWGTFIRAWNLLFAGLLATNFFEPAARFLEESIGSELTYFYDFLAFWGVFAVFMVILHSLTAVISRVSVRFNIYLDRTLTVLSALSCAGIFSALLAFSLHFAPLGTSPFGTPLVSDQGLPIGLRWGLLASALSQGTLSRTVSAEEAAAYGAEVAAFPGKNNIFEVYQKRQEALKSQVESGSGFKASGAEAR
ncbi:MAG: hypothetical protein ACUVTW_06540 [Thermogutta sp.]